MKIGCLGCLLFVSQFKTESFAKFFSAAVLTGKTKNLNVNKALDSRNHEFFISITDHHEN